MLVLRPSHLTLRQSVPLDQLGHGAVPCNGGGPLLQGVGAGAGDKVNIMTPSMEHLHFSSCSTTPPPNPASNGAVNSPVNGLPEVIQHVNEKESYRHGTAATLRQP